MQQNDGDIGVAYCIGWVEGGKEGSSCCMGRLLLDTGPPPFLSPLSFLEQLDTVVDTFLFSLLCGMYVVVLTGLAILRLNHLRSPIMS